MPFTSGLRYSLWCPCCPILAGNSSFQHSPDLLEFHLPFWPCPSLSFPAPRYVIVYPPTILGFFLWRVAWNQNLSARFMEQVLTWCLLCAKYCSKLLTGIASLTYCNNPMMWALLSPFNRWGHWSPEKIRNLSRVTQLVGGPISNTGRLAMNLPVLFGGLGVHVTVVGVAKIFPAIELDWGESWTFFFLNL